ncbi:hypothetical protein BDE02_06G184900 [Populus trichocarpa]|nr:hypothetical protein BDE02_06G184900 [Populus trichocarpa]
MIFLKNYIKKIQKFSWNFHEINDVRKATLTLWKLLLGTRQWRGAVVCYIWGMRRFQLDLLHERLLAYSKL